MDWASFKHHKRWMSVRLRRLGGNCNLSTAHSHLSILSNSHTGHQKNVSGDTTHIKSVIYQPAVQPLCQPLCSGVGDLTSQVVPLLVVHELQRSPQVLQQMQHPKATQERRSGRLAVKQPVGVIHGLGAWADGEEKRR